MSVATPALPHRPRIKASTLLIYAALVVLAVLFLTPYYLIFRNALLIQSQILSFDWTWLPIPPHLENVKEIFDDPLAPMATGLRNSAVVAVIQTVGQIGIASLAGYGLARVPYRWSNVVFYAMLLTLMIPGAVTFVPLFVLVSGIGWVNTLQGLIVPHLFNTFAAFLFRQFYIEFPHELEEAGRVDGLNHWGIYWYILVPNSLGIMFALGLIAFISIWNAFLWPLIIGQTSDWWTVQVVLATFLTAQTINLPALFMGAAIAVLPLVIIFVAAQRYIVEGVTATGIKG